VSGLGRRPGPPGPRPTGPGDQVVLRGEDGALLPLDPSRWHGPLTAGDRLVLADIEGPVLDIGCGPGRIVAGLALQGVVALGVDPAPGAVALARARGCPVLQRSVFEPLPGEGRWASVLLFDGNLGIGGDPVRLLRRCRALARRGGAVIVEVEAAGTGWRTCRARLERAGEVSTWFAWSVVGADAVAGLAERAGLELGSLEHADGRCFAHLSTGDGQC
jgi:SAM-dependent methyltransferase